MPPCSHIRLFSCKTLWSWTTTAGFARRRSESDCFQKQLWGDTWKLFKTCAWILKCRQNLHQNAVGHPIACRTQAWLADFISFHFCPCRHRWNLLVALALACKSFLLQKAYSKGTCREVQRPLQFMPMWKLTTECLLTYWDSPSPHLSWRNANLAILIE